MHLANLHNEYARALGSIFDKTPKAVLAAIAVSVLTNGGDNIDRAKALLVNEWEILYANGIVPQKPSRKVLRAREIFDE